MVKLLRETKRTSATRFKNICGGRNKDFLLAQLYKLR